MDVVAIGETMVAFDPDRAGRLRSIQTFHKFAGGAETNTLIGLQRLGFSTRWISLLGDDEFGRFINSVIRGEGVDTSPVRLLPNAKTGLMFIERNAMEDCTSIYYRDNAAIKLLSCEHIQQTMIADAKILYFSGITPMLSSTCCEAVMKAMEIAHKNDVKIAFDPNIRLKLYNMEKSRKILIPIIKRCNIFMPNVEELKFLFPNKAVDDIAKELLDDSQIRILVIKKGTSGATCYTKTEKFSVEAFLLKNIASSMGAGDAFNAGFLAGILEGQSLEECLNMGAAVGAFTTMGFDSYQMLPSRKELDDFLTGNDKKIIR